MELAPGRRVLVIDDDRDFAEAMADALGSRGHTVELAHSANAALSVIDRFRPAAALVEVRLGEISGTKLIPEIKARIPDAVCVIVTAHPDIETAIDAVRFRANDYLQKPISPDELCDIIDHYLDRTEAGTGMERAKPLRETGADHPRDNSFGRLLVHRFSHLFFDPMMAPDKRGPVPRRVLPGFFAAVEMMLGAERVEKNQQICRDVVAELSQHQAVSGERAWEAFYAHEKVNEIAVETEMLMAAHFKNFDRRAEWFTNVILNNGPSASDPTDEQKTSWPPSEKAVMMMLSALFSDLRSEMSDDRRQRRIAQKFGERESRLFAHVVDEAQRRSKTG
ncbi:MAG: response regulator [Rhodospirillales bacterium]|nr:response regulator [Rhodospirillales bacterium]